MRRFCSSFPSPTTSTFGFVRFKSSKASAPPPSIRVEQLTELAKTFKTLSHLYTARNDETDKFRSAAFERASEKLHLLCQLSIPRKRKEKKTATTFTLEQIRQHLAVEQRSTLWHRIEKHFSSSASSPLSELQTLQSDARVRTILFVSSVLGFGFKKADTLGRLVQLGQLDGPIEDIAALKRCLTTLQKSTLSVPSIEMARHVKQLSGGVEGLTHSQQLGLAHHEDLIQRIPRTEISQRHEPTLQRAGAEAKCGVLICGSYRRLRPSCGDIDCIIWDKHDGGDVKKRKKHQQQQPTLERFVTALQKDKYIVDSLAMGKTKFMGLCKAKEKSSSSKVRRLDIRWVPVEMLPTAVQYFTGSAQFNVMLRNIAIEKGLLLNEYGLWRWKNKKQPTKKQSRGKKAAADDDDFKASCHIFASRDLERVAGVRKEKDIFDALGLAFVPPEKRE